MEDIEKKIARVSRIPGLLNWARQNFMRVDKTQASLQKIADAAIQISLSAVYNLCQKRAYRQISADDAWTKALNFQGFPGRAAQEILPVFEEYLDTRQIEAPEEFRDFRVPFPIGKSSENKTLYITVRPTFVSIQEGKLRPVFLVGWVDSPLDFHQRRLIAAIIRRAILTQADFLNSDAEIVTFVRQKFSKQRQLGVWKISDMPDYTDAELFDQFRIYNTAVKNVVDYLKDSATS